LADSQRFRIYVSFSIDIIELDKVNVYDYMYNL